MQLTQTEIVALKIISLSELYKVDNKYTEVFAMENPDTFKWVLYDLGIDINKPYEHQVNQHRNAFNEVYTGSRWVGDERTDTYWLESGYASQEAKDKAKGSKLLVDLYRSKGLTSDRISGVWENEQESEKANAV